MYQKKYLLQIEPKGKKSVICCSGKLTKKEGRPYKGHHMCICGEQSGSCDLFIRGYITNSLAVHYLEWHRKDVPEKEIAKLKSIKPRSKRR